MIFNLLVSLGMLAAPPSPPEAMEADLASYDRARATVGRDAEAHVRLALWCEAHGLRAERVKHLALAVLIDPAQATARGLMGLVAYRGRWERPVAVAEKVKADEALAASLAEYNARRSRTPNTADAQWKLALWCEAKGLDAEAHAHHATVVRLDPGRESSWKRLGCKKVNGRWVPEARLAAEKAEAEAQKQADKRWRPSLEKWRAWLGAKTRREEAERYLAGVTDPRAVPAVLATFAVGDAVRQAVAVQVLGQIDAAGASRALALLSVSGGSAEVRRKATETLKGRDPREFADLLIASLRKPVKYEVRPVGGPGSPGLLFVEGRRFNVQRRYTPTAPPRIPPLSPSDWLEFDANGLPILDHFDAVSGSTGRISADQILRMLSMDGPLAPANSPLLATLSHSGNPALREAGTLIGQITAQTSRTSPLLGAIRDVQKTEHKDPSQFGFGLSYVGTIETQVPVGQMMLEARKTALVAQAQLQNDVATIESYNSSVCESNSRVSQILSSTTGEDLGQDREAWKAWWVNQLGYSYRSPEPAPVPTYVEDVPLAYQPQPIPVNVSTNLMVTGFRRMSCFGAGTLVRSLDGTCPIEAIKVGDRVLSQDTRTGALGYHPVTVIHHNPPSPTFLVRVGGDTIVSSPFHRFWVVGRGWVMARDLEGGETLRLLDGPARIAAVEPGPVQPVFNLDVDDDHDFFAGAVAALVHDNTLPDLRRTPFDAPPILSAIAPAAK